MNKKVNIAKINGSNNIVIQDSSGEIKVSINREMNKQLELYINELERADIIRQNEINEILKDFLKIKHKIIKELSNLSIDNKTNIISDFNSNLGTLQNKINEINKNIDKILRILRRFNKIFLFLAIVMFSWFICKYPLFFYGFLNPEYKQFSENPIGYYKNRCIIGKGKYCTSAFDSIFKKYRSYKNLDSMEFFINNFCKNIELYNCKIASNYYDSVYFEFVLDSDLLDSYDKYIKKFGENCNRYLTAIDSIQSKKYVIASKANTLDSYNQFISEFGDSCKWCKLAIERSKLTSVILNGKWQDISRSQYVFEFNNGTLVKNEYGVRTFLRYELEKNKLIMYGKERREYTILEIQQQSLTLNDRKFIRKY